MPRTLSGERVTVEQDRDLLASLGGRANERDRWRLSALGSEPGRGEVG